MSLFANNNINPSTGELVQSNDSVLIAYNDLRIVNSKLIELEYEKEINSNLKQIIVNDSIIIKDYTELNNRLNKDCNKAIKQRNICVGAAIIAVIVSILCIVK